MGKYTVKRNLATLLGFLDWQWKHIRVGLYVFNYHRIGNSGNTLFDPNVFSATEEQLSNQLKIIQSRFRIIGLEELFELQSFPSRFQEPVAMITFDDGYIDNYTKSFPILKSLNTTAVFFISTSFIGNSSIPWWEEIAWILRNTKQKFINFPELKTPLVIDQTNIELTIKRVLRFFKDNSAITLNDKMSILREECAHKDLRNSNYSLFMSWEQVKEMHENGMDIGSHTCSHKILSHLSREEQLHEIFESKKLIEAAISHEIKSLAYPVGGLDTFDSDTVNLVKQSGYQAAFSFPKGGGVTQNLPNQMFRIPRMSLDAEYGLRDIQYKIIFSKKY